MAEWFDLTVTRTWWEYDPNQYSPGQAIYHWFNLLEGIVWLACGCLVARRFLASRRSGMELWYAVAFVAFAATDFREAFVLQSWLLWVKLVVLIALLRLRRYVIARFYPESRVL